MKVDTVIVGAGTAGLSALREVRRYTDDFLMVNDGHWGTTCAAVGCMPSKALIEAANAFHQRGAFDEFGIRGGEGLRADIPAVLARVRKMRDQFVKGPKAVPEKLGDRALSGRARLLGPRRLEVNGKEIEARAIILAPGSRPVMPGPWRELGDRILTTDSLFDQRDLPRRIAVIGMGAIGVEIAQALARLGLEVAGFDATEGLAGIDDAEVLDAFRPLIAGDVDLYLGTEADLKDTGDTIRVSAAGGAFEADAVLAAIGRRPNIDDLGLDTLGVPLDEKGMPGIDPCTLQIGDLSVFMAGDANGIRALLHEAADEGHIAGRMAAPDAAGTGLARRTSLSIVFSTPQVARIGATLSDLEEGDFETGSFDFSKQARARMAQTSGGVLRIYATRDTGRLLGAEICAPAAEHLAHLLALAVEQRLRVADMLAMPFYHPVLEEGLRSALRDLAKAVPGAGGSDLSDCEAIGHDALD
ncbi:MAG: dihydrolipoyl dehydrogenase [Pseudomonadota bacterium]|uniref:dihydrolipoyl dehydrogenase n=1 Tax=Roseovarius salincola TaxID=2978479 RepID=UPI0022A89E8F|nr:dihydrolipoyl dehydrogenase [Roseovarius sp. EGI FJ00037]MCZ0813043.1 dihydrolipoyl dehydrogenase [Roseovarius sp. EGI FJ00037]